MAAKLGAELGFVQTRACNFEVLEGFDEGSRALGGARTSIEQHQAFALHETQPTTPGRRLLERLDAHFDA